MKKQHFNKTASPGFTRPNILLVSFSAMFIFGGLSILLLTFPSYFPTLTIISCGLGITGFITMILRNYSSKSLIQTLMYIDLIILCTLNAIRSYDYIFPSNNNFWTIVIVASVLVSYLFPSINSSLTRFLRIELTAPKTSLGKIVYRVALLLIPIGGAIGSLVGMLSARNDNQLPMAVLYGNILWMIALLLPFGSPYPISLFEKKE